MTLAFRGCVTDIHLSTVKRVMFQLEKSRKKYTKKICNGQVNGIKYGSSNSNVFCNHLRISPVKRTAESARARIMSSILVDEFPNFLRSRTIIVNALRVVPNTSKTGGTYFQRID
jgi:hypothetical protein